MAFPTETVYGLGANARDAEAVARIFAIKDRPRFDPLIVHIADVQEAATLAAAFPDPLRRLATRFWPGPLTLVLPKRPEVPDIVTAGLPTVALRVPAHPVAQSLIRAGGVPVAAPSANRFGCISPTRAEHVRQQLGDRIDALLDGGPCPVGVESTIIACGDDGLVLLRAGGTPLEAIEAEVGPVRLAPAVDSHPQAPGRLSRHYAPGTPLEFRPAAGPPRHPGRVGLLCLEATPWAGRYAQVEMLSAQGSLTEAAANLFAALRRLDDAGLDWIEALPVPEQGLGRAINDRLRRAARPAPGPNRSSAPQHKE